MQTASLLPLLAMLPFAGAAIVLAVPNERRALAAWIAAAVAVAGCALVAATGPAVFAGEVLRWRIDWVPQLGLAFGFRVDGLAWLFALLILGIGALIVLYAAYYLDRDDPAARFFAFLLFFMGAMLGIVLADNLILLIVFWELTSVSSFLLIGYWHRRKDAREGARMALAITGAGGLALLGGALLIGSIVGSLDLDDVLAAGDRIRAHRLYLPALLLVLLGAFTKSAQFPFHFWLPQAMVAPTPVSAYLHSATMVKAGVFLLARMYPALGGSDEWFYIVSFTGLATLVIGAYLAIFQHDLKGLLAYSTISHLGLITLLFGLNTPLAVVAGVFHILNHATFKASLFMAAGIIDHETGSRDMRQLSGLLKYLPITGPLAMVAAGAMAGVPLLNGFLSKEMFFTEALVAGSEPATHVLLPVLATLAGVFSVAYSARFIHDVFFGPPPQGLPKNPHEPPRFMRVPVELLVVLCLAVGVAPGLTIGPLLAVGAQAALYGGPYMDLPVYKLAVWHGLNLPFVMSVVALVGGLLLYFGLHRFIDLHRLIVLPRGGREAFLYLLDRVVRGAQLVTGALQNGKLQSYVFLLVLIAVAAGLLPWLSQADPQLSAVPELRPVGLAFAAFWLVSIVATVATVVVHRARLMAVIVIGALGLTVSLLFVFLSAPDLALTQLLVEFVTIVLMMLALNWLPREGRLEHAPLRKLRDGALALAAGAGVTIVTLVLLTRPSMSIAPYFLENSVRLGGGSNVVNVILVDFRGYDTLGEITVLGIAGLVIFAALQGFQPHRESAPWTVRSPHEEDKHPLMLALVSRLLLPLAIVVSLFLFLRGHNQPGGGFIAGLVLAIALILQYVANGQQWLEPRLRIDFRTWIGWGLLCAGLTGVGSWVVAHPFLTSSYAYPKLPLVGAVPVASAVMFDLGVYLTVVGATMVALKAIARLKSPARVAEEARLRAAGAAPGHGG
jgi:multicomponent K+:H+ antiporter subunit A